MGMLSDFLTLIKGTQTNINGVFIGKNGKIDSSAVDSVPTANSINLVTSGGVKSALRTPLPTVLPANATPPYTPTQNGLMWVLFQTDAAQTNGGRYTVRDVNLSLIVWSGYTPVASAYACGWFYAIAGHQYEVLVSQSDSYAAAYFRLFPFSP